MKFYQLLDGDYGKSYLSFHKPDSTHKVRKSGTKLFSLYSYLTLKDTYGRVPHNMAACELTTPENAGYWVALNTGEMLAVKSLGHSSCIASIERIFQGLGFSAHVIWKPKESWTTWSKRWSKKITREVA